MRVREKKLLLLLNLIFICVIPMACGGDKTPALKSEGLVVKLTATPRGVADESLTYTTNIEIYNDCTIRIYADDFVKWYGKDEPETVVRSISEEELTAIRTAIEDEDLYHMHRDVGNKDGVDGIEKSLTIYTVDGEYTIYGISPSNVGFNRVYDMIYELKRTELSAYIINIEDIQREGSENDIGLDIRSSKDEVLFDNSDISEVYVIEDEIEADIVDKSDDQASENDEENYRIVICLTEDNIDRLSEITRTADAINYMVFNLYTDNKLNILLYTDSQIVDGRIVSNSRFTKEAADEKVSELLEYIK